MTLLPNERKASSALGRQHDNDKERRTDLRNSIDEAGNRAICRSSSVM
jgi:hypothetical protein